MSRYADLCRLNQKLYAELEQCTYEKSYCQLNQLWDRLIELNAHSDSIKTQIQIHLDAIEEIWRIEQLVYRPAGRLTDNLIEPTLNETKVILSYLHNPNQQLATIAEKHRLKEVSVSRIITKLLNKEYKGY